MHSRPALAVLAAVIVALSASALVNHPSAAPSTGSLHGAAHSPPLGHVGGARSIPAPSRPFVHPSIPPPVALTIIFPNGTISNATAPITRDTSTNTYTLTASFIGGILDERNGSTLVGAGKTLTADASLAFAIEVFEASSVNVTGI
ncbi:MAG TPA: hypothetical protein VMH90_03775, partial [Thermoplasmata archaeon]|nr:hypothetical protein [Thermoplasmata archaeon]